MKSRIIFIITATLLLLTAACSKQIEFQGEILDPIPVLISNPVADTTLGVRLSYSRFFLSNSRIFTISNASFNAFINGVNQNATFTYIDDGYYQSNVILHEGDSLTLQVSIPGNETVTAGCRMPLRPIISDITIHDTISIDSNIWYTDSTYYYGYGNADFSFQLHDPADQHNYYLLRAILTDSITGSQAYVPVSIDDQLIYNESAVEDEIDIDISSTDYSSGSFAIFSDELINGRNHTIQAQVYGLGQMENTSYLRIEFCSISRDTYLWLATRRAQENDDDIFNFASEPVQLHCNVKNGIGILGAFAPANFPLITFSIPQYYPYYK